jgi:hypothetical protein
MASCILVIVTLRKHNTIQKTKFSNTRDYIHHQHKKEKARLLMFRLIVAVMSVNLLYWIPQVMLTIVSVQSQSLHWSRLQVFLNYFNAMKGMILFIAICTAIKWSFQSVSLPVHNDTVHDTLHDTVHDTVEKNSSIQMPSIAYSDTVPMNSINRSMMFNRPMFSRPALQDSGLNII